MRTTIQTNSGTTLDPFSITTTEINLLDIAHSLSQICRFQGHTSSFYSVAQHSVLVARKCPKQVQLAALLHDATEAYICDLVSPIKERPEFTPYRELEASVFRAITRRFELPDGLPSVVHDVDKRMFVTEARDLMTFPIPYLDGMGRDIKPYLETIVPLPPDDAKKLFLRAYDLIRAGNDLRST